MVGVRSWTITMVTAMVFAAPGWADEGRGTQGGSPTTPPHTEPQPKEPVDGRSGPVGGECQTDADPGTNPVEFTNLMDCLTWGMTGGGYLTAPSAGWQPTGLLQYTTTLNGGAPPDMCICENNPDIQYTELRIPGNSRIAKFRKFSDPVAPEGGAITLYLNDVPVTFQTELVLGSSAAQLNAQMLGALQSLGASVSQTSKYFIVHNVPHSPAPPKRIQLSQVGFYSSDPGLTRSEISLEPTEETIGDDWLECATGLGPSETRCGY